MMVTTANLNVFGEFDFAAHSPQTLHLFNLHVCHVDSLIIIFQNQYVSIKLLLSFRKMSILLRSQHYKYSFGFCKVLRGDRKIGRKRPIFKMAAQTST